LTPSKGNLPRKVRNFWLVVEVDGLKHPIAVGPPAASGGMKITLGVRVRGKGESALTLECAADVEGQLTIRLVDPERKVSTWSFER